MEMTEAEFQKFLKDNFMKMDDSSYIENNLRITLGNLRIMKLFGVVKDSKSNHLNFRLDEGRVIFQNGKGSASDYKEKIQFELEGFTFTSVKLNDKCFLVRTKYIELLLLKEKENQQNNISESTENFNNNVTIKE